MGRKRIIRFCLWKTWCACHYCLNVVLAFMAILLTGLVLLNSLQREVPVPDKLTAWAVRKAIGSEYRADWRSAVFDLRGGLYLEGLTVSRALNGERLLSARSIHMDWSLAHLLFGVQPVVNELKATGVELFVPSSHSPSGLNEPVMEIHQAHAFEDKGNLVLHNLFLESRGIRVHATGTGNIDDLLRRSRQRTRKLDFNSLLARIRKLPDDLSVDCGIQWKLLPDGSHHLSTRVLSGSLQLSGATFSALSVMAEIRVKEAHVHVSAFHGDATLAHIDPKALPAVIADRDPSLPIRLRFSASGDPTTRDFFTYPEEVTLSFVNPYQDLIPAEVVLIETSLTTDDLSLDFTLKGPQLFASGTAIPISTESDSPSPVPMPFSARFRVEFHQPELHAFFPNLPRGRLLENTQAGYLRLNARSNPSFSSGFTGILVCDRLFIGQTLFSHIRSDFTIDSQQLQLPRIHIQKTPLEHASGSYFHHFPSSRFSLNATGSSFPSSLDSLLGRWWVRIFQHIRASYPLPADVTVWGHWSQPEALQSFTAVRGGGAVYRELPVPDLEVRVRSNREWAYLEKLEATFAQGSVRGQIGWGQGLGDAEWRPMVLDFRSDANWEAVVAASGIEALEELVFSGNPRVRAKGVVWQAPREWEDSEAFLPQLRIELDHPEKSCWIGGLEVRGLSFSGWARPDIIELGNISGGFAEGVFAGSLDLVDWSEQEGARKHLQIQMFDASYALALEQLAGLMENPASVEDSLLSNSRGGRVDTSFDLWLGPGLASSRGNGRLTIRDARLGQIHIFGGLSRFLDTLGLGFSTLDLDSGYLEWQLSEGVLEIPDCLITGPVLNLKVDGSVNLIAKALDLQADAAFFQGIVSKILTPVSDNFLFDIRGSLEDPIWKLRLNPFRWLQNRIPSGE